MKIHSKVIKIIIEFALEKKMLLNIALRIWHILDDVNPSADISSYSYWFCFQFFDTSSILDVMLLKSWVLYKTNYPIELIAPISLFILLRWTSYLHFIVKEKKNLL